MADWRQIGNGGNGGLRFGLITGSTDNSLYTSMMNAALKDLGIEGGFQDFPVAPEEFEECVHQLKASGYRGLSIGNPHKVFAARVAERFFLVRDSMGLANCLTFQGGIFGKNTEVSGVMETVSGIEPGYALVMGAGQGARSVVMGLIQCGWKIRVWNRNAMKSRLLQTTFNRFNAIELVNGADPSGCKLIVNATTLGGKAGEQPPLIWRYVQPKAVCLDLVYRRVATEFLRAAALRGLRTIDGRELVVEQAAEALEWWTGEKVEREPMRLAIGLRPKSAG